RDRYDEPCGILNDALGVKEEPRDRLLIDNTKTLPDVAEGEGEQGVFTAVGVRGRLEAPEKDVVAHFKDGAPAILRRTVGEGEIIHFAWMPGLSYWKSSSATEDRLPVGFSETIRQWITWPTKLAEVDRPVVVD